jgi:hypothetical protein
MRSKISPVVYYWFALSVAHRYGFCGDKIDLFVQVLSAALGSGKSSIVFNYSAVMYLLSRHTNVSHISNFNSARFV